MSPAPGPAAPEDSFRAATLRGSRRRAESVSSPRRRRQSGLCGEALCFGRGTSRRYAVPPGPRCGAGAVAGKFAARGTNRRPPPPRPAPLECRAAGYDIYLRRRRRRRCRQATLRLTIALALGRSPRTRYRPGDSGAATRSALPVRALPRRPVGGEEAPFPGPRDSPTPPGASRGKGVPRGAARGPRSAEGLRSRPRTSRAPPSGAAPQRPYLPLRPASERPKRGNSTPLALGGAAASGPDPCGASRPRAAEEVRPTPAARRGADRPRYVGSRALCRGVVALASSPAPKPSPLVLPGAGRRTRAPQRAAPTRRSPDPRTN